MAELTKREAKKPPMDWVIEALKVLREVRDWSGRRAKTGEHASVRSHAALEEATARVEVVIADDGEPLVRPIGPASQPEIARAPSRGRRRDRDRDRRDGGGPQHEIPIEQIDGHALSSVRRLRSHGYKAYLVGGCVRDLLLGLLPKDFDVSTDARPEEIKRVFRNSRIIGRRFRLVHLYFRGGKIIEVSTFRANLTPDEDDVEDGQDLLVRRDNVFGTEEEDALRRDFTINGLFYDVHAGRIIDHVGGLDDVRNRYLRMIGDPEIRLREDPVRILRAIRFTAKANLRVDPELWAAMRRHTEEVVRCAPARVLEETLKMLRTGHAEPSIRMMDELGLLETLLPEVKTFLDGETLPEDAPEGALEAASEWFYAHLHHLDKMMQQGPVSDVVILGALLSAPLETYLTSAEHPDRNQTLVDFLTAAGERISLTRKLSEMLRQVFLAQRHLGRRGEPGRGKRRRRRAPPETLMARPFFADALNLYEIRMHASEQPLDEVEEWYHRIEAHVGAKVRRPLDPKVFGDPREDDESNGGARSKRRRRRGGRRRR